MLRRLAGTPNMKLARGLPHARMLALGHMPTTSRGRDPQRGTSSQCAPIPWLLRRRGDTGWLSSWLQAWTNRHQALLSRVDSRTRVLRDSRLDFEIEVWYRTRRLPRVSTGKENRMAVLIRKSEAPPPLPADALDEYAGQWIAVRGGIVIASADDFDELVARDEVESNDLLYHVPPASTLFY